MWKKVLGGTLAVAMGVWMLALIVPQPAPPAWGDVWWWRNQLILLTGVAAWALMSLIMVLAVRPAWLEKPLDGLDKSYRLHKWAGIGAIVLSLSTLFFMLATILMDGVSAFRQATITFPVTVDAAIVDKAGQPVTNGFEAAWRRSDAPQACVQDLSFQVQSGELLALIGHYAKAGIEA